ncbi:MAG: TAXI family TRAP transporter solute-binding subunit [Rhodospirillaceae bacterium]|nr:TAXI family TRAP transporter solute-binding subunit [Rhodospirillaceae bacterium]
MRNAAYAIAVCVSAALAGTAAAESPKYNFTIAGYSPGGLVSTVGTGLDAALSAAFPGSTITYQTSSGGLANAMLLERKSVPLAFIADTELDVAMKGKPPIKTALKDLRMLFRPYAPSSRFQATHVLANKAWAEKNGIATFADIAKKKPAMRVAVNRPGNLDGDVSLAALAAIGATPDAIKSWGGQVVRAASREITSLMLDRRVDVTVLGISYNHPSVREMANGVDLVMLPMDQATAEKVAKELGAAPCAFKAKEYAFLAADSASVCVGMSVIVRADMDDQTAYNLTKGVVEQIDKFKAAHRLLQKVVTVQTLAEGGPAPFHPGAAKYLKEKGLLK